MIRDYKELRESVQNYLSTHHASEWRGEVDEETVKSYMNYYLDSSESRVPGLTREELVGRLYRDMVLYGFLTEYLDPEKWEEININSWDDISLTARGGEVTKCPETFESPKQALDIVKRLLRRSGRVLDGAVPIADGHLPGNIRVTALGEPVVDEDTAVSASIRLLRPRSFPLETLVAEGMLSRDMAAFLRHCLRYGVSLVVVGTTGSGKTTLLNAVLETVPDTYRIFTIETGAREITLRKKEDGRFVNNVVHTLSRPSAQAALDITQEDLVVSSLRFHPNIVVVGEMRDVECYAAVEASLTGHTVVSTVHAGSGSGAHTRIALLCQKRLALPFDMSLRQAAEAFPVVVFVHAIGGRRRRVMDISECVIREDGRREYRTLFRYEMGRPGEEGAFRRTAEVSDALRERLREHGAPTDTFPEEKEGTS